MAFVILALQVYHLGPVCGDFEYVSFKVLGVACIAAYFLGYIYVRYIQR